MLVPFFIILVMNASLPPTVTAASSPLTGITRLLTITVSPCISEGDMASSFTVKANISLVPSFSETASALILEKPGILFSSLIISPPRRVSAETPNAFASFLRLSRSGVVLPFSH